LKEGALIEPPGRCCVGRAEFKADLALVIGGGPIGFLTALVARLAGAEVLLSDVSTSRLQLAREAGLRVIDARSEDLAETVLAATHGEGADVVFGAAAVRTSALDKAQEGIDLARATEGAMKVLFMP
jgi:(R,R)-butanediol dehydrogenase/meso-butanediol dehydrogenase/diacetyl reductase